MDAGKQTPFRVADWRVDPASNRIIHGDKVIRLEPRVMDMLVYLADRPGQVVTRDELEANIWKGRTVSYDALTSAVQKLRKAFDDDARQPRIIETLSKKGYRLVAPVGLPDDAPNTRHLHENPALAPRNRKPWLSAGTVIALMVLLVTIAALMRPGAWNSSEYMADKEVTPNSIAVLPFDNLSGDPAQEYFADGMTDDLITRLARSPGLLVIARDSSFFYKNQIIDPGDLASKLGVRYILHGSIRRANEQLWVNAQLIDATTSSHLWAERYDARLGSVFDLQDDIIDKILSALSIQKDMENLQDSRQHETSSTEAYDYFLHGRNRFFLYASKEDNRKARVLYQKAIELDPGYALAYAMLAWTHAFDAMNGWSELRDESLAHAHELAARAVEIDRALPVAYFVMGLVYRERGEYMKALVEAEKAIAIDPSYANAHVLLATLLYYAGRPREGLEKIKRAMTLNPHHPYNYPFHLGQAYFVLERYQEAIEALEQGLETNPSSERMRVWLAAAYARAGREEDANWEAEQVLALNSDFSLQRIQQAFPFKDPADMERFLDGLRIAGFTQ